MEDKEKASIITALLAVVLSPFIVLVAAIFSGIILALPCLWIYNALIATAALALPTFSYWQWVLIIALVKILVSPSGQTSKKE